MNAILNAIKLLDQTRTVAKKKKEDLSYYENKALELQIRLGEWVDRNTNWNLKNPFCGIAWG